MKGYEGLNQPFSMTKCCISTYYNVFMKSEGLTNKFIDIYNYYGYTVVLCSYNQSKSDGIVRLSYLSYEIILKTVQRYRNNLNMTIRGTDGLPQTLSTKGLRLNS